MIYVMSILGHGDSLITGTILERDLGRQSGVKAVGTEVTRRSWALLRHPLSPDFVLFPEIPGFYSVRENGVVAATRDIVRLRHWARRHMRRGDMTIFEHHDKRRNFLIMGGLGRRLVAPRKRSSAYWDRSECLGRELGIIHEWKASQPVCGPGKQLVVNPRGRHKSRALSVGAIRSIARVAKGLECSVTLLDPHEDYAGLETEVDAYERKQPLHDAAQVLRGADRYIGPDSFFSHLAYYFGIPQLSVFRRTWLYFVPPGLSDAGGVVYEDEMTDESFWEKRVEHFIGGS